MSSRRAKGEGMIRKRADGRWEGRFIDSTRQTRYIYRYSKSEVSEELKKLVYLKRMNIFDGVGEYSCVAKPPVQCSVSHLSRRSAPQ